MTSDQGEPADRYYVGGAGLPSTTPSHPFPFAKARRFQRIALDWIHDDHEDPPVSALGAPTGSGKTAVIAALADAAESGAICTYPTNALIHAQTDALREIPEYDLTVESVTGATLSGTGEERSNELLDIAERSDDVVITNPDVLQAIVQNAYYSPGDRVFEFFSRFSAAVFDEFHYYDPLATSGLLMQIRILADQGQYLDLKGVKHLPRVLLTSATPDEQFVASVTEDFGIDAQIIRSRLISLDLSDPAPERLSPPDVDLLYEAAGEPPGLPDRVGELPEPDPDSNTLINTVPAGVSRFRYPMIVNRWTTHIGDVFDAIATMLDETCNGWEQGDDPVAAVVFNSAARSNAFHSYIHDHESLADLAAITRKDNGYDTKSAADDTAPGEYAVLNTTSKGEVGLNFDLQRLIMAAPWTTTAFIQRVGRAARQSPATVDVFGLADPTWPTVQSYTGFLARVQALDGLQSPTTSRQRLRELAGMRAGRAIQCRYEKPSFQPDIEANFEGIPARDRWSAFLRALNDAAGTIGGGLAGPTLDVSGQRAIRGAEQAIKGLDSLRGRSVQAQLIYPVGAEARRTEYDLVRALRHYPIKRVDADGTLRLGRGTPTGQLTATYPESPLGDLDMRQSDRMIEQRLTDAHENCTEAADLRSVEIDSEVLKLIFQILPLRRALVPATLDAGWYRLTINREFGEVETIDDRRSD